MTPLFSRSGVLAEAATSLISAGIAQQSTATEGYLWTALLLTAPLIAGYIAGLIGCGDVEHPEVFAIEVQPKRA